MEQSFLDNINIKTKCYKKLFVHENTLLLSIIRLVLCSLFFNSAQSVCQVNNKSIFYFTQSTIPKAMSIEDTHTLSFGDSLFLVQTKEDIPLYYFQRYQTGVCFDNKCRPLDILIYWNITGRYLGFKLPDGEFLSKTDHEPFKSSEYERMHELLANSELPFSNISFYDIIVDKPKNIATIDGTSGATAANLSKYVVQGAAYTTYTLWNIVYGANRQLIMDNTVNSLTTELIERILKSPDQTDKIWILECINEETEMSSEVLHAMQSQISGDDFYLAYKAIHAIKKNHLSDTKVQDSIITAYPRADHSIKSLIIDKLLDAPFLSEEVIRLTKSLLHEINGKQLGDILKLYDTHKINDKETIEIILELTTHQNFFIANQAKKFLEKQNLKDE